MRRLNRPPPPPDGGPPRDPRPRDSVPLIVAITSGLALYLGCLWFGVVVIGDTMLRSAVMAGVILAIAATGYVFTHASPPGGR